MGTHLQSLKSNLQKSFDHLNHHHGTNARTRQGYELLSSPIRPKGPKLAPTFQRRDRRLHHEALEERLQAFRHRCPDPRPVWSFPVQIRHRKQNPPSLESSRYGPRDPRRSLLLDQEGCLRPKAFGKKTERTNTVNFDLFLSNPESTDLLDTTNSTKSWPQPGNTTPPPLLPSLHKFKLNFESMIKLFILKFAWY